MAYPIAHDSRDKKRMRAISDISLRSKKQKSWAALTRFRKLWDVDGLSLLEIEMETGVTHQIRVHLAAIGTSHRWGYSLWRERPGKVQPGTPVFARLLPGIFPSPGSSSG